jgi:hypothetical protein
LSILLQTIYAEESYFGETPSEAHDRIEFENDVIINIAKVTCEVGFLLDKQHPIALAPIFQIQQRFFFKVSQIEINLLHLVIA